MQALVKLLPCQVVVLVFGLVLGIVAKVWVSEARKSTSSRDKRVNNVERFVTEERKKEQLSEHVSRCLQSFVTLGAICC